MVVKPGHVITNLGRQASVCHGEGWHHPWVTGAQAAELTQSKLAKLWMQLVELNSMFAATLLAQVFISDIRACQNREQELKRVDKELAKIRKKFSTDKASLSGEFYPTVRAMHGPAGQWPRCP